MWSPLLYRLASLAGVPAVARLRDAGVILCYHNVVPDAWRGPGDPGLHCRFSRFVAQIAWLRRHYDVVSLAELAERMERKRSLRGLAALTFDDAYDGVFQLAVPVLRGLGVPATVFVVVDAADERAPFWWDRLAPALEAHRGEWIQQYAGDGRRILAAHGNGRSAGQGPPPRAACWATIRTALKDGVTIGAHTISHRMLPALEDRELFSELGRGRGLIAERLGVVPEFFAYPYGGWDDRVRDAVRASGYRGAVTLDPGVNGPHADRWALRRMNIPAGISLAAFDAWTAGLAPMRRPAQ
jgi:peptidoglycan/xylan/chitin deacetylase (PgdA/CDA1 family)